MTELVLKGSIDRKKLDAIVGFLRSWGMEVEVKEETTGKKEFLLRNPLECGTTGT